MSTRGIALTILFIMFALAFTADIILSLVRSKCEEKGRTGTVETLGRINDMCIGSAITALVSCLLIALVTGV